MKLIVGLGNPGPRYRGTFHNVGFDVVDEVARRRAASFEMAPAGSNALLARVRDGNGGAVLVKPLTFMNVSGDAVGALQRYFRIELEDMLVVVDDVALPTGRLRVRRSGSAGGHNGLKSIIACLGTDGFARLRVGVGRGDPRRDLADHVLSRVTGEARETLVEATGHAADAAELFLGSSVEEVMLRFNAAPKADDDGDGPRAERGTE
ncbi:MAG: aminoacyl-tRNA hydrolase [Vicinamibacteraceae bacterium]